MKKNTVDRILLETESGYDTIARKFSQTRKHFWRSLEFIKDYTHENDNVLDFGCGNGRLHDLLESNKANYWGVDVSAQLIEYAQKRHVGENVHFAKINPSQISLAFEPGFFNSVYSIAVFHHFPSEKYRQDVADELFRVTKNGGHVVVTVWYLWPSFSASWRIRRGKQKNYFKNIVKNWKEKIFEMVIRMFGFRSAGSRHDSGVNNLDWNDCLISFTDNEGKKFQRFHHAFSKRELKNLFEKAGFETERCAVVDGRNILYIGKKE